MTPDDKRYEPIILSMVKIKGDMTSTPEAMATPPNFGVGCAWICLFPGRATAPLLFASSITSGTERNDTAKALRKAIYNDMNQLSLELILIKHYTLFYLISKIIFSDMVIKD